MKFFAKAMLTVMLLSGFAAAEYVGTYYARLGRADHFNSYGDRLNSVAAIIRQDRFNFHVRGIRQYGDTWDQLFQSKANRARMERMIRNGYISRSARRRIVNGTPLIRVDVYSNHVNVKVISRVPRSVVR